jgi:glycerol-3-phosphate responsive antiterminator|tara:strand:- start:344 stop:577 length:234 start_codon:yes stop_codon:yes gene_type:complete
MNTIGNQNIYIKLNILENKVNDLDVKLDKILSLLEKNSEDCKKMSSHIDFIDGVYENVKAPMNYICDTMNNRFIENR